MSVVPWENVDELLVVLMDSWVVDAGTDNTNVGDDTNAEQNDDWNMDNDEDKDGLALVDNDDVDD